MSEALCDKFTKADGKRGKPAKDSLCAVCDVIWTEHFNEAAPERGEQQPVKHPEMVRVIPEPKRRRSRSPRAILASAVRKVAGAVADYIEPDEPDVEVEAEPEQDLMACGHAIEALQEIDGEEACEGCRVDLERAEGIWEAIKASFLSRTKVEHPEWTDAQLEAAHEQTCGW